MTPPTLRTLEREARHELRALIRSILVDPRGGPNATPDDLRDVWDAVQNAMLATLSYLDGIENEKDRS